MIEAEFGQLQDLQNKFLYGFEDSLGYLEIKRVEVAMDCCKSYSILGWMGCLFLITSIGQILEVTRAWDSMVSVKIHIHRRLRRWAGYSMNVMLTRGLGIWHRVYLV